MIMIERKSSQFCATRFCFAARCIETAQSATRTTRRIVAPHRRSVSRHSPHGRTIFRQSRVQLAFHRASHTRRSPPAAAAPVLSLLAPRAASLPCAPPYILAFRTNSPVFMNSLVTLLVLTPTLLLAISLAYSPDFCSGAASTSHQPPTSTAPTQSPPPTPCVSPLAVPSVTASSAVAHPPEKPSSPSVPTSGTHSVSPPRPSPTPSISPPALEEQVFIPLKEWKERKLQHIESRVRNGQARVPASPNPSPRAIAKCLFSRRHFPIAFFTRVCFVHERFAAPNGTSERIPLSSDARTHQRSQTGTPTAQTISAADAQLPKSAASPTSVHTSSSSPSTTARHANSPARITPSHLPYNRPSDELLESDSSVFAGLHIQMRLQNVIPSFGSIVRSLFDASQLFAATPFPSSFASKPDSHSSHHFTAPNNTNSSSAPQLQPKRPVQSSSTNFKKRINSNSNYMDRSNRVVAPVMESPSPDLALTQHNLHGANEKPFNFASADAGARVLAHSEGVVGAKNVLIGSVDKYLLAPCDGPGLMASRWIDLELSEDVILESIETANFEYYSSSARKVAVLGASSYPPKRWNILGVFDFRNVKSIQRFHISKRVVTRFLRIMYSGKQGDEYYCPVSTIRAFGKNLIADWKDVFEEQTPEDDQAHHQGHGINRNSEQQGTVTKEVRSARSSDSNDIDQNTPTTVTEGIANSAENAGTDQGIPQAGTIEDQYEKNSASDRATETTDEKYGHETQYDETDTPQGYQDEHSAPSTMNERSGTNVNTGQALAEEDSQDADSDLISEDDRIVMEAVRTDALAPVSGDDNIFRKVTRMLRLLELNQTLTNQYIDSQLSRFARVLASTHSRASAVDERVAIVEKQMMQIVIGLEARVDDLLRASFVRDVAICVLLISVAILVGAHCVLWAVVSGARLQYVAENRVTEGNATGVDLLCHPEEVGSPITAKDSFTVDEVSTSSKRKKKKFRKAMAAVRKEQGEAQKPRDEGGKCGRHARSSSSVELASFPLTTQALPPSGRAFHVLGSSKEN
eukprot:TRINITY_DN1452_c1_g1_i1.p2 TRINITY_DN1452_c1_g1~~TRINITY_DN1452_c1_g1_i1.p2  ORF type:complete len:1032 (+),score=162.96 TRINITY_DN1452_c1_g1_i1:409-3504(+)